MTGAGQGRRIEIMKGAWPDTVEGIASKADGRADCMTWAYFSAIGPVQWLVAVLQGDSE